MSARQILAALATQVAMKQIVVTLIGEHSVEFFFATGNIALHFQPNKTFIIQ